MLLLKASKLPRKREKGQIKPIVLARRFNRGESLDYGVSEIRDQPLVYRVFQIVYYLGGKRWMMPIGLQNRIAEVRILIPLRNMID